MSPDSWHEWAIQVTEEIGKLTDSVQRNQDGILELRAQMLRVETLLEGISKRCPTLGVVYSRAAILGLFAGALPVIVALVLRLI